MLKAVPTNQCTGSRVDKYGRQISDTHEQENLKRFYRLEDEDEDEDSPESGSKAPLDYARGEVLLESSDEDEEPDEGKDRDSDSGDFITIGHDPSRPVAVSHEGDGEIDLDESIYAELDAQAAAYNAANPHSQQEDGERTRRLAIVNLDWDHVRASHLFKIVSSLLSPSAPAVASSSSQKGAHSIGLGKVLSVRIYPSEFGKERLAREEKEGPPAEIFKNQPDLEEDEVNEQNIYEVGGEDEYDEDALRKYQLERLRCIFPVVLSSRVC